MEKGKNVSVYCGSRYGINPAHTAFAGMAGELLAKNGYTMIYGGGSVGLMGIAADAALAAGGKVVGFPKYSLPLNRRTASLRNSSRCLI